MIHFFEEVSLFRFKTPGKFEQVFFFLRQIVVLSFNLLQRACTLSQERSLSIQFAHQGKSPLGCVTLNTSSCANFEPSLAAGAPFARLKLNLRKHSSVIDDLPPQRDVDKNDTCLILGLVDRLNYISRALSISLEPDSFREPQHIGTKVVEICVHTC